MNVDTGASPVSDALAHLLICVRGLRAGIAGVSRKGPSAEALLLYRGLRVNQTSTLRVQTAVGRGRWIHNGENMPLQPQVILT